MIESRQIAKNLGLDMKIGDVEYQGDGNKAIFYYIADERVDFRQLIKDLAATFHVRIEMKQIGARQEAGRIGGTGPCGRELCCATWMKNFSSVSTNAARFQNISLNPTKLAGMCAKLKCCLNYEVDTYMEASKKLPSREVTLLTMDGEYHLFKTDILSGECTYSTDRNLGANMEVISAARAREIIEMNRRGEKPYSLQPDDIKKEPEKPVDLLEGTDLSRFDKAKKKKKKNNRKPKTEAAKADKPSSKPEKQANKPEKTAEKAEGNASKADKAPTEQNRQPRNNKRRQRPDRPNRQGQPRSNQPQQGRETNQREAHRTPNNNDKKQQ